MEEHELVELYWQRDEAALAETERIYGRYLTKIARNILGDEEDSRECVNDVYLRAWDSIPPQRPARLSAYLGKLTRDRAIDRYRHDRRMKRRAGQYALSLEELSECLSAGDTTAGEVDLHVLAEALSAFLRTLPDQARDAFVCRYWAMDSLEEVARRCGMSVSKAKSLLYRTRLRLKEYLQQEGFAL